MVHKIQPDASQEKRDEVLVVVMPVVITDKLELSSNTKGHLLLSVPSVKTKKIGVALLAKVDRQNENTIQAQYKLSS